MFEVIDIINQLGENGMEVIFVRQPELSTTGPHREQIKEYLELGLSLRRIRTIINPQLERPIGYPTAVSPWLVTPTEDIWPEV